VGCLLGSYRLDMEWCDTAQMNMCQWQSSSVSAFRPNVTSQHRTRRQGSHDTGKTIAPNLYNR